LQSLTFVSAAPEISKEEVGELLDFVSRIPAADLRTITYDIRSTTRVEAIDEQALTMLDDALFGSSHTPLHNLERVQFKVPQHASVPSDLLDRFRKGLPRAHKKGVLAVEVVDNKKY
jgi:hypothetical protein